MTVTPGSFPRSTAQRTKDLSQSPSLDESTGLVSLSKTEKRVLSVCVFCSAVALLFPLPVIKVLIGAILLLVFLVASWQHFYLGVGLFIFYLPLRRLAFDPSSLAAGLNVDTLFLLYFLFLLFHSRNTTVRMEGVESDVTKRNPITLPLCGLFVTVVFSAIHSNVSAGDDLYRLFQTIKGWFIFSVFAIFAFNRIRRRNEKLVVLLFIILATSFNAVYSLRTVLFGDGNLASNRAVSVMVNQPNLYGGFLAMYLLVFLALLLFYPLSRKMQLFVAAGSLIVGLNLVYTLSRGSWLAFLGATCLLGIKSRKLLYLVPLFFGLLVFWTPEEAKGRWESTLASPTEDQSSNARVVQWQAFWPMLKENLVFGIGHERYREAQARLGIARKAAHSTVIKIGVEQGLLGLTFYLWILAAAFTNASRVYKKSTDPLELTLSAGLMAVTLCLFLLDLSGTRFVNGGIMAYYWILIGITLNETEEVTPLDSGGQG